MQSTHSAIQTSKPFSPFKSQKRLLKASSMCCTNLSTCSTYQDDKTRKKQKIGLLNKSVEEQINKSKMICQSVKQLTLNNKTPLQNSETTPAPLKSYREKGKIVENNEIFRKLRSQYQEKSFSSKKVESPKKKQSPKKKKQSPKKKLTSLLAVPVDPLNNLQQIRQIQSFMLDEDEDLQNEISIVEEHGAAVLDWGVCMGKATEFKILKFLDEGKFGKVYLAQSHRNNMICSIKAIYRTSIDETTKLQLIRQVKIQSFLDHPHIVKLYNFFVDEDSAYLVLQPCLGKNLYQNLKEVGKMNEKTVKQLIRQVCSAVEYMHKNNIIHRDIKPQNILLHQNMIKICDFGWAIHSPLLRVTQCGTPLYNPPEVVSKQPYDSKIDIWSIGVLTYELLYGTIPFQIRQMDDMAKIIEQQVYFSQQTDVSEAAKDFMMKCMHKNPSQRFTIRKLMQHEFLNRSQKYRWTIM